MAENLNINPANQISIQQIISNSNFAQFLSEHLSHNNVSQSEITNLLNLFSRQLNLQQNQNNNNNNFNEEFIIEKESNEPNKLTNIKLKPLELKED